jgi:hypothetical protein
MTVSYFGIYCRLKREAIPNDGIHHSGVIYRDVRIGVCNIYEILIYHRFKLDILPQYLL